MGTGQNYVIDRVNTTQTHAQIEFAARMQRGSTLFARLERVDFIKCDIEGYEVEVIPEMAPVIERHRPTVLIESGGEKRKVMTEFFLSRGYSGYTLSHGRLKPLSSDDFKDMIFIHGSRMQRYQSLILP